MKFKAHSADLEKLTAIISGLNDLMSNEYFQFFLDAVSESYIIVDQRGSINFINSASEALNEIRRRDYIGKPIKLLDQEHVPGFKSVEEKFQNAKEVSEIYFDDNGCRCLFITRTIFNSSDDVVFYIIYQQNIDAILKLSDTGYETNKFIELKDTNIPHSDLEKDKTLIGLDADHVNMGMKALKMGSRIHFTGESGTGKTEVAQFLHASVMGKRKPFIHVNCGSIPETLFESELFGYERGSFTGANQKGKLGLIEAANGGTLFLDEVGEIPMSSQPKLLNFLENGTIQKVGSTVIKKVNVKVISATNRDLFNMVKERVFREDLYYRLSVIVIDIPSLKNRVELIPKLVSRIVKDINHRRDSPFVLDDACMKALCRYHYPGNIRELQNILEYAAVCSDGMATLEDFPFHVLERVENNSCIAEKNDGNDTELLPLKERVRNFEKEYIEKALDKYGSKRKTAEALKVDIATVVRKLKR